MASPGLLGHQEAEPGLKPPPQVPHPTAKAPGVHQVHAEVEDVGFLDNEPWLEENIHPGEDKRFKKQSRIHYWL